MQYKQDKWTIELNISDEFELKFPKLSQAELKSFRAESRQAGHFNFRAEIELDFF